MFKSPSSTFPAPLFIASALAFSKTTLYLCENYKLGVYMKPVFAISLFLLALPMVAAETPMSYVRFTTPDPLAL